MRISHLGQTGTGTGAGTGVGTGVGINRRATPERPVPEDNRPASERYAEGVFWLNVFASFGTIFSALVVVPAFWKGGRALTRAISNALAKKSVAAQIAEREEEARAQLYTSGPKRPQRGGINGLGAYGSRPTRRRGR